MAATAASTSASTSASGPPYTYVGRHTDIGGRMPEADLKPSELDINTLDFNLARTLAATSKNSPCYWVNLSICKLPEYGRTEYALNRIFLEKCKISKVQPPTQALASAMSAELGYLIKPASDGVKASFTTTGLAWVKDADGALTPDTSVPMNSTIDLLSKVARKWHEVVEGCTANGDRIIEVLTKAKAGNVPCEAVIAEYRALFEEFSIISARAYVRLPAEYAPCLKQVLRAPKTGPDTTTSCLYFETAQGEPVEYPSVRIKMGDVSRFVLLDGTKRFHKPDGSEGAMPFLLSDGSPPSDSNLYLLTGEGWSMQGPGLSVSLTLNSNYNSMSVNVGAGGARGPPSKMLMTNDRAADEEPETSFTEMFGVTPLPPPSTSASTSASTSVSTSASTGASTAASTGASTAASTAAPTAAPDTEPAAELDPLGADDLGAIDALAQ
jgi:hypothetical protein